MQQEFIVAINDDNRAKHQQQGKKISLTDQHLKWQITIFGNQLLLTIT
jgi:hypothetical protein